MTDKKNMGKQKGSSAHQPSTYQPPQKLIDKYAQILVNFALNSGEGVKPGEVVECIIPDVAKPMALALQNEVLKAKAHPMIRLLPTGFAQDYYTLAQDHQLEFFPQNYWQSKADLLTHRVQILADPHPNELKNIDPSKIIRARDARKPFKDWLTDKENKGQFTWTIALWGVEAKANEVGLSLEDYWQEIFNAVYLNETDPVARWKQIHRQQEEIKQKLNSLPIQRVYIQGPDADLKVEIGLDRRWVGGSGRNIPSFEIFTSPNWRGTEGWMKFNEPVYRYGNVIKNVYLEFKNGLVTKAKAEQGNDILQEMIKSPNANKLGEVSMTDKRMSCITHPMAETLFDENMGGKYGNSHVAIGAAFRECYRKKDNENTEDWTKEDWDKKGINDAAEHTDFVTTIDRTVTAELADGTKKIIYKNGQFVI
ncbi:MAG: aminopeptidase [Patescibacteria group bacterium]|nr:aminopeptidase [Patescibacteria group bacterium]